MVKNIAGPLRRHGCFATVLLLIVAVAPAAQSTVADETVPRTDALGDPLPENARLRLGTLRFRHPSSVGELALSPDEQAVVTLGRSNLIVWDVATGKERWRANPGEHQIGVPGASYGIRALAFAADSSRFYTTDGRSRIVVWNINSGDHETITIEGSKLLGFGPLDSSRAAKSIDVTADGQKFAVGGAHGALVCDASGHVQFEIANNANRPVDIGAMNRDRLMFGGHYSYCRFSPNEKILAVVTSDAPKEVQLVHASTGQELRRILLTDRLVRLAFSPDSRRVITTERDVAARMYAVDTAKQIWAHKIDPKTTAESYTSAVAYSPNGQIVAVCAPIGSDYGIRLLDAATGTEMGKLTGHTWKPWAVSFTADSKTLYSSGWDGPVRRWDIAGRRQLPLPKGIRGSGVVAAASDGDTVAYCDDSGTIRLVDAFNGKELRTFDLPGTSYDALTFSTDSQYLAGGGTRGEDVHVVVWHVRKGRVVHRWDWAKGRDPHSSVECLSFTPDGKRLAAAIFRQNAAYLWDLTSKRQIGALQHADVYGLSFSPDGKTLATAGWDKKMRFWDANSGVMLREMEVTNEHGNGRDLRMYTVCYAPKGGLIATAHLDGVVRIWNAADMTLRSNFEIGGSFIFGSICFSADGTWLATGSASGRVALWDPLTAEGLWEVGKHQSYVYAVSWPDNRTLLTGGSDGVAYVWDLRRKANGNDLNGLWKELASGDDQTAFRAMCALLETPDRAVTLLAQKVQQGDLVVGPDQVRKWIDDLDSSDDAVRGAARAGLATVGSVAVEPVREAAGRAGSPERTQYLREILARLEALAKMQRRAVSLLARLDTERARLLLKGWASQDPHSVLGRAAGDWSSLKTLHQREENGE